jgi:hypothetical protein
MIDLHERLSEFSYGYGVTRDVEQLLSGVGIRTIPFLPSLLQEKQLAFDVGFSGRGAALLLQFKLGQTLRRFVRSDKSHAAPLLERPFFRFSINTAEPDGQFETLLKAESDGAEAYYVAPRFTDWPQYVQFFESGEVLERSVMVTPSGIRGALVAKGIPDGPHRIVYDRDRIHVCSEPVHVKDARPALIAQSVLTRIDADSADLGHLVHRVYAGLGDRTSIRRESLPEDAVDDRDASSTGRPMDERDSKQDVLLERDRWLKRLIVRSRSEEDAVAAALGLELWSLGIQLIFAVKKDD